MSGCARSRPHGAAAPSALSRFRLPRLRLVVPAVAATALAAAALIAVVRPAHQRTSSRRPSSRRPRELDGAATDADDADRQASAARRDTAPGATSGAPAARHGAGAGNRPRRRLPGADRPRGEGRRRALERDRSGRQTDRARSSAATSSRSQYASSESGSASLTLRVPTAKVQDAIAQLTALGKITSQQVQIRTCRSSSTSSTAQITVLRGRIAHITALLANPDLTPERRAQLEAQRAQLQSDLRSIRQQSAGVSQQAALATIQLTLATKEGSAVPAPASRVRRTLDEAGRILAWEGVALLYGLVVVGPFALARRRRLARPHGHAGAARNGACSRAADARASRECRQSGSKLCSSVGRRAWACATR